MHHFINYFEHFFGFSNAEDFNPGNCFNDEKTFVEWNKPCVEDTIQIFAKIYELRSKMDKNLNFYLKF